MESFKCVDCDKQPPEAESAYTLIGGKSGWRLTRRRDAAGGVIPEWRCPDCWAVFRRKTVPPPGKLGAPVPGAKRG
jgi:hypothetical protein